MHFYTNVRQYGKYILYRGVENGKRVGRRIEYRPTFFVPSNKPSKYKTLAGKSVEPVKPGNINDAYEFLKQYKDVETFPIFGNNRYAYTYISDQFPDDIIWDKKYLAIAYIDIEVGSENGFADPSVAAEEVLAITVKLDQTFHTFAVGDYSPHRPDVTYTNCTDEAHLLREFLDFWSQTYPDIISGWNCKFFDMPYLINRMLRVLGEKITSKISPWGKVKSREVTIMGRTQEYYEIFGISVLDYLDLFKKYSPVAAQESYKLDHVAFVELGEGKLDYSEYETLHQLYKKDFQKFIEYNIRDVDLVERIEETGIKSNKLIELALTLAYDNKVNYDDVFSQVRMWDTIIFNYLKKKDIVVPAMEHGEKETSYSGAFVKNPLPGAYNWVASFDLNSLYPHLIMQYNISSETLIEPAEHTPDMSKIRKSISVDSLLAQKIDLQFMKNINVTVTPNKQFFTTAKRGFLGEIMDDMYQNRLRYKTLALDAKKKLQTVKDDPTQYKYLQQEIARYDNLQKAKKLSLNSAYGAIGNQYFRFFDIRIAEAITMSGQLSYKWIEQRINKYLNSLLKTVDVDYVIAGDTDSMYLNLETLIHKLYPDETNKHKIIKFMDKVCEERLQPFIDKSYQELADYINAYEQKMQMKREFLVDRAIWTAKKRYILNIYNEEGVSYKTPKIKIVGLEAIKSSTPQICRDKIREAIKIMLDKDEAAMIVFIDKFRESFHTFPAEDISFPRSVNSIDYYSDDTTLFKKGTPIHVKGAIVYNHILKEKNLTKKYELIKSGEKIKFCYLKQPNPYHNNTIAFINNMPKEIGLQEYLDYDTQFNKAFLEPLKTILTCIGWHTEEVSTLESFFA